LKQSLWISLFLGQLAQPIKILSFAHHVLIAKLLLIQGTQVLFFLSIVTEGLEKLVEL